MARTNTKVKDEDQSNTGAEGADDDQDKKAADDAAAALEATILAKFKELQESGKNEDDIKLGMIGAGATFKNVTRLFNKFMVDAGLAISKEDRNAAVEGALTGLSLESESDFDHAVELVVAAVKGANERSASALVRGYAKKNELACFSKPKGDGAERSTFRSEFYAWLIANKEVTKEQAESYVMGTDGNKPTSENVQRHISAHMGVFNLVQRVRASYAQ